MLELHRLLAAYRGAGDDGAALLEFDDAAFRAGRYHDGTLLRFRGVVRDVQDPELVLLAPDDHEASAAAAADDVERFANSRAGEKLVERVPLKVALFPHRTQWAASAYERHVRNPQPPNEASASAGAKRSKRPNDAVGGAATGDGDVEVADAASVADLSEQDAKKPKAQAPASTSACSSSASEAAPFLLNLISVYVYEGQYADVPLDAFRVNEAFDFVGVLDLVVLGSAPRAADSAVLSADALQRLQISEQLDALQQRQRSGAVLHCCDAVAVTALHHVRPHAPRAFYAALQASNAAKTQYCAAEWARLGAPLTLAAVRDQLVTHLAAAATGGDALAAEYLVLALLARVYSRPDPATPLGNLSLNLALSSALAADAVRATVDSVGAAVRALVPVCAAVDLALASLNASAFAPHKDYETDAMVGGALQVPHGTVLLVDETALSAGELSAQGVKNVGALQSLVAKLLLPYDFQFYSMDFPQDVAVVSVSQGKSILPVTVSVPLAAATGATGAAAVASRAAAEPLLDAFRVYFGVLRSLEIAIGNEQAEVAEKHYVACRQAKQEVSLEDLHRWLRLARLVALSRGDDSVTKAAWDHMLALEAQRLERLQA
ncbi:hypothetical protein PybrP1_001525 [[Pythium] brassicae (nom. inval.)]|nr:hypothetical protein PybrP1_001525 [[Pythium] brassicae (nom. inval.)]